MGKKRTVLKTGEMVFPKVSIGTPHRPRGTYDNFLKNIKDNRANRPALASAGKSTVDAVFERRVKDTLRSKSLVERYMQEGVSQMRYDAMMQRLTRSGRR